MKIEDPKHKQVLISDQNDTFRALKFLGDPTWTRPVISSSQLLVGYPVGIAVMQVAGGHLDICFTLQV